MYQTSSTPTGLWHFAVSIIRIASPTFNHTLSGGEVIVLFGMSRFTSKQLFVGDRIREYSNSLDFDTDDIAGPEPARRGPSHAYAVRSAGENNRARRQRGA